MAEHFDEWQVGDTLTHDIRRTVTETDNLPFTATHNPQPLHLDAEAAKAGEFGQILIYQLHSLMQGSARCITLGTLVANPVTTSWWCPSRWSLAIRCMHERYRSARQVAS